MYFCQLLKRAATEMYEIESVLMTAENGRGQLFKAVGDITKHSDISRISQMNCSKSFKQFASKKKKLFCFIISVSNIDITISCILAGQLTLQNSFKL